MASSVVKMFFAIVARLPFIKSNKVVRVTQEGITVAAVESAVRQKYDLGDDVTIKKIQYWYVPGEMYVDLDEDALLDAKGTSGLNLMVFCCDTVTAGLSIESQSVTATPCLAGTGYVLGHAHAAVESGDVPPDLESSGCVQMSSCDRKWG